MLAAADAYACSRPLTTKSCYQVDDCCCLGNGSCLGPHDCYVITYYKRKVDILINEIDTSLLDDFREWTSLRLLVKCGDSLAESAGRYL